MTKRSIGITLLLALSVLLALLLPLAGCGNSPITYLNLAVIAATYLNLAVIAAALLVAAVAIVRGLISGAMKK